MLKCLPANFLILYRVTIDEALDKTRRIEELERLYKDKESMYLDEEDELSKYFDESPPKGRKSCIIVEIPEGEAICY